MTRSKSKPAQWLRLHHPLGKLPTLAERLALVGAKCPAPMTDNDKSPLSLLSHLSSPEPPKTTYLDANHHLLSREHDSRKIDQLCYYCGHTGHFYWVCPRVSTKNSMPRRKHAAPCSTSITISSRWEKSKQSLCLSTLNFTLPSSFLSDSDQSEFSDRSPTSPMSVLGVWSDSYRNMTW